MTPAILALIISLVEEAIKDTPELITSFKVIFSTSNPTPADWEALRNAIKSEDYSYFVPNSNIPKS
jgi:hypothetical protein